MAYSITYKGQQLDFPDDKSALNFLKDAGEIPSSNEGNSPSIGSKLLSTAMQSTLPLAGGATALNEMLTGNQYGSSTPLDVMKNTGAAAASGANTFLGGIPTDVMPQSWQDQYSQMIQNRPGASLLGSGTGAALQAMLTGGSGTGLLNDLRQIGAGGLAGYSQVANDPSSSFEQRGIGAGLGAGITAALKGVGYAGKELLATKFGQKVADFIQNKIPFTKSLNLTGTSDDLLKSSGEEIGNLTKVEGIPTDFRLYPLPENWDAAKMAEMADKVKANGVNPKIIKGFERASTNSSAYGNRIDSQDVQFLKQNLWGNGLTKTGLDKAGEKAAGYRFLGESLRNQLKNIPGYDEAANTYWNASKIAQGMAKKPSVLGTLLRGGLALGGASGLASGHNKLGALGLMLGLGGQFPGVAAAMSKASPLAAELAQAAPAIMQLLNQKQGE